MADRYVNYDKLLEERHRLGLDEMSKIHKVNAFNQFIDRMSTADVAEVKHGYWESREDSYFCSECGSENCYAFCEAAKRFTDLYCPNCGAKMDGGKNNG